MVRAVWSVAIVLIMVASAFAVVAYAGEDPTIWPSEEYYIPGETVQINGKGWSPYAAVTIVMTHPDFESEKTYVVIPELYGNFACTNYTAEGVMNWKKPVIVTATQTLDGVVVTATTQFFDPAVTLEGYTLRPNPGWTAGDIKGYNEGDSVPYKVKLEAKSFGSLVTVTLGFDYRDVSTDTHGIDYLTEYNAEPPTSPFNTYPESDYPFWVDGTEGAITDQHLVGIQYDSGTSKDLLVWQFTLEFATGAADATVRWGSHMAVTYLPDNYYGASYFPGSSLHVRIVALDPSSNQGNRDVPIALGGLYPVLTPPEMTLDKWVEPLADPDPQAFKIGDTITFTVSFSNIGQADAKCVMIDDYLPSVVAYVEGSAVLYTSENPTHYAFAPATHTSTWLEWGPFAWRGTGEDSELAPLIGYIQFQAIVLESATPGIYWNEVHMTYSDDHGGFFEPLYAEAPFQIVGMPTITIEKSGTDYAHVGDTITYSYVVSNTGPTDIVDLDVWDDVAGWVIVDAFLASGGSVTYTKTYTILATDPDPLHNIVYANGEDEYGQDAPEATDYWDVDILHPAITVTKVADKSCAALGEDVRYTIHYTNSATDDTVLYDVTITDALLGIAANVGTLNPGEGGYIYKTIPAVEVSADPDGEMPNTVTALGHDILNDPVKSYVIASASWTVDIKHPAITIDKWATYVEETDRLGCVGIGDVILWHITVSNPSSDTEMDYEVFDPLLSDVFDDLLFSGALDPLGSFTWVSDPWTVPDGVSDPLVNTAWVEAQDSQGHFVFDENGEWPSSTVELDVLHPGMMIDKWATYIGSEDRLKCVAAGDYIIWHVTVHNPSADTTMYYDVYDPLLSDEVDDLLFDGTLAAGASFTWTSEPWLVPEGVSDPLVNTVWVEAYDAQGHPAYDEGTTEWPSDRVEIDVLHPMIGIDKWATYVGTAARLGCVGEGDVIIWHITVSNPSADTYMNYEVWDPRIDLTPLDPLFSGRLAPLASDPWASDPWTVPVGVEDHLINIASVDAWDDQDHHVYDAEGNLVSSKVDLDVLHPAITIDKWATYVDGEEHLGCVGELDWIVWHIKVTNPSADTDMWFDVYDPMLSDATDDWLFGGMLTPSGEIIYSSVPWQVPVGVENPLVNTAWVVAYDQQYHYVRDLKTETGWPTATVSLEVLHPQIAITKEGPAWANIGATITYYVNVTNIGDAKLFHVYVFDSLVGYVLSDAELDVGQTVSLTYTYIVPEGPDPLVNYVDTWGYDRQDHYVEASDSWTVQKLSSVNGYKLIYLGNFGTAGVNEWTVRLQGDLLSGGYYDETRQTDTTGYFEFLNLEAGTYTLSELMQTGWIPLGMTSETFLLDYGEARSTNFVNMPIGSISGAKWHDANLNGLWDNGELGVGDWTIILDGVDITGATVHQEITTAADGSYSFFDLYPGLYTVSEGSDPDWFPMTLTHVPVDVSAYAPFEVVNINFGNARYGQIIGCKWIDEFMNGVWDGGELPVAGWTIWLEGDTLDGEHVGPISTTTGANGWYAFTGLKAGTYTVWEVLPAGWVAPVTPTSHEFTLVEGSVADCGKFGNVQYGSIPVSKFLDWDMDGDWDPAPTEPGIGGWMVTLTGVLNDPAGTIVGPIVKYTDANGEAVFDNLLPGKYTVTEELPAGWYNTNYDHKVVIITSGWNVPLHNIKFGNVPYTCVWGYKFDDTNGNGRMDDGEKGVPEWTITITGVRADGVAIEPLVLTTDEDGLWQSCYNLLPGEYTVTEASVEGWMPTTDASYSFTVPVNRQVLIPAAYHIFDFGNFKMGKIWGYKYDDVNGNGMLDTDDVPIEDWVIKVTPPWGIPIYLTTDALGYWELEGLPAGDYLVEEVITPGWIPTNAPSETVTIVSHSVIEVHTFLNTYPGMIWGYKFEDLNGNGLWDIGEQGLPDWMIFLMQGGVVDVTTTDASGYYEFLNVWPGEYTVEEAWDPEWEPTTLPYAYVTVHSGDSIWAPDFGNWQPVWIELFKFEDVFHDGIYDNGDAGMMWEFTLTSPSGIVYTMATDGSGSVYMLLNEVGVWTVSEMSSPDWCPTTPSTVQIYVESGHAYNVATQEEQYYFEFGNFNCVTITIFKYEDVDSDGRYDPEVDNALEAWEIVLQDALSGQTVTLYTDENGLATYKFCNYGVWSIVEMLPPYWNQITPDDGGYQVIVYSGHAINVASQMDQYYFEFGNFQCVEITVFKYWDKCSSGWYEPEINNEPFDVPIEGWYFELRDEAGNVLQYGWTDENGELTFWICHAGTYYVVEEDRAGWSHINPIDGVLPYTIVSGMDRISAWFGNYEIVKVPVFKYEDVNSDGDYDVGYDIPLSGWHFDLVRIGDGLTYSGETDANGNLVLSVDRSGLYVLTEEDRADWRHVNPADGELVVAITSGTVLPVQMFGNFHIVQIPVFKFDDIYANGIYNPADGDAPVASWTFQLWEWNADTLAYDILLDTQVTDATGHAMFTVDHAGFFLVTEESREGWFWIYPLDGDYNVMVVSGKAYSDPEMTDGELQFANFKMGKIYGYKWNDLNGDGDWDTDEPALQGWTIHFRSVAGFFMEGSVQTDVNGYYEFTGLPPALYNVWEDQQPGWTATSPPLVSDVQVVGHSELRIDFFNFDNTCIVGHKYIDLYGDGVYDPDEDIGLPGWTIYLWWIDYDIVDGLPISAIGPYGQTVTDENGYYAFCNLPPGTYEVTEEIREDWIPTSPTSSGALTPTSGQTVEFNFLNFEKGCVCGYKFEDSNSNGIWDTGERALMNWPIHMIEDALPTVYTTYTNENGWFCFSGLGPDYYMVYEDPRDTPDWVPTTTIAYIETMTSGACIQLEPFGNFHKVPITVFKYEDVNSNGVYDNGDLPIKGWSFEVLDSAGATIASGVTDENGELSFTFDHAGLYSIAEETQNGWTHTTPDVVDIEILSGVCYNLATDLEQYYFEFGNYRPAQITVFKFYDWNMNGLFDGEDYGLTNWIITLHGDLYNGEIVDITRQTGSNGIVEFTGLLAGVYTVTEAQPLGWHATIPPSVTLAVHSGDNEPIYFANVLWGMIWGHKFYDKNLDGIADDDEPGLGGWTIVLEGTRDDGTPVYETCITDGSGYYAFTEVQPGLYTINEIMWPTWQSTSNIPFDVSVGNGGAFEVELNIGNIQFAKIWGYKFLDTYAKSYPFWPNGVFDADEYGLGNWEITLDGDTTDGVHVHLVTYTDNIDDIGYYEFVNLLPGTYTISETLLHGYWATTQLSKTIVVYPFPLGPVTIQIDFGNLVPTKDPTVNFVLQSGWNMWSTPIDVVGLTAKGLLNAVGPNGLLVMKIDKAGNCLQTYMAGDDELGLPDFQIVVGEGYYVYALGDTVFQLTGDLPGARTESLTNGWNFIGHDGLKPMAASQFLAKIQGGTGFVMMGYNPDTGNLDTYVVGDDSMFDFQVTPGRAYFVYVIGSGTISY